MFPYDETEDQLTADRRDTKRDMESRPHHGPPDLR